MTRTQLNLVHSFLFACMFARERSAQINKFCIKIKFFTSKWWTSLSQAPLPPSEITPRLTKPRILCHNFSYSEVFASVNTVNTTVLHAKKEKEVPWLSQGTPVKKPLLLWPLRNSFQLACLCLGVQTCHCALNICCKVQSSNFRSWHINSGLFLT